MRSWPSSGLASALLMLWAVFFPGHNLPELADLSSLGGLNPKGSFTCSFLPCCLSPQAVEKLVQGAEGGCHSEKEKQVVLNCSRLLTRVLPYIFEDPDWRGFFWSTVPGAGRGGVCGPGQGGVGGSWQGHLFLGSIGIGT